MAFLVGTRICEYCIWKVTHLGQIAAACSPSLPCSRWPYRCPLCSNLVGRENVISTVFLFMHLICNKYHVFIIAGHSPARTFWYIIMWCVDALWRAEKVELLQAALIASPYVLFHLNTLLALFIKPIKHSCRPAKSLLVHSDKAVLLPHTWGTVYTMCFSPLKIILKGLLTKDLQHI